MKFSSSMLWALVPLVAQAGSCRARSVSSCKCMPGDSCWPSKSIWDNFNATVDGLLVKTVPIGTPCHDPTYDADECATLQDNWNAPETHLESTSSVMQQFFANDSCDPFTAESKPCTIGNYVDYAVKVQTAAHVAATIKFATKYNIRFVIRSTGHDYFGRSTGAGAISVWTHEMTDSEYIPNYSDSAYTGPAFKFGAGTVGYQALEAATAQDLVVVSGECATVCLVGGYTQGGGHSALSTSFGLGADNTLEFEVVTAAGNIVTANADTNSDLYWALSGGGAGNYGVVTALTVRGHHAGNIGGGMLTFTIAGIDSDTFYAAIEEFHKLLPAMIATGADVIYVVSDEYLAIKPVTVLNSTGEFVENTVLGPFITYLNDAGLSASTNFTTMSYYEHFDTYMGPLPWGNIAVSEYQYGGRLIPNSVVKNNYSGLTQVIRTLNEDGVLWVGNSGTFKAPSGVSNAVLPQWRNSMITVQIGTAWNSTEWDQMITDQELMTNTYVPLIESITPGAGAYMNEADFNQPNWETTFYGSNWSKLLAIKKKWDPNSFFYSLKAVGSSAWTVANNGRMCKA